MQGMNQTPVPKSRKATPSLVGLLAFTLPTSSGVAAPVFVPQKDTVSIREPALLSIPFIAPTDNLESAVLNNKYAISDDDRLAVSLRSDRLIRAINTMITYLGNKNLEYASNVEVIDTEWGAKIHIYVSLENGCTFEDAFDLEYNWFCELPEDIQEELILTPVYSDA